MERSPDPIEPGVDPADRTSSSGWVIATQGLSKLLLGIGGFIFFFGDRALREFWHVPFGLAMLAGIGVGIAVMLAGGALQFALPESERMRPRRGRGR